MVRTEDADWGILPDDLPGYRFGRDGSVWSRWVRGSKRQRFADTWHEVKSRPNRLRQYHYVTLKTPEGRKHFRVNVLTLWAFTGFRPPGMEAAHKNGVRTDNRVENLEWKTHVENIADKEKHGTQQRGESVKGAKLNGDAVRQIRQLLADGRSRRSIARDFAVSDWTVREIDKGTKWGHVR